MYQFLLIHHLIFVGLFSKYDTIIVVVLTNNFFLRSRYQFGRRLLRHQLESEQEARNNVNSTDRNINVYSADRNNIDEVEGDNNSNVWFVPGPLFCCWNVSLQKRLTSENSSDT